MTTKNPYEILGLDSDATAVQIKKSYRTLASKFHPDKNGGNLFLTEQFKEIQEAYRILSSPEKRRKFDLYIKYLLDEQTNMSSFHKSTSDIEFEKQDYKISNFTLAFIFIIACTILSILIIIQDLNATDQI